MAEEKKTVEEDYEKLLEEYKFQLPTSGEIVQGKVIGIRDKEVIVDIGSKLEGAIPLEEFTTWEGKVEVKEGDEVEAIVERGYAKDGYIPLSKRKLEIKRALELVNQAYKEGKPIEGTIIKKEKKGFMVDLKGIKAFLPASQLEIRPVKETYKYIGKTFPMKILDIRKTKSAMSIIVSRRILIEEEIKKKKKESFFTVFNKIKENFQEIYRELAGGDGELLLENPEEPFEGGLYIKVKPAGKRALHLNALSGGEKSIASLAFIFALQAYSPSPFYVLDEIDMFLDEKNADRVANMIASRARNAQFIVISLRRITLQKANHIYGVTSINGKSTIIGNVNLNEIEKVVEVK